MKTTPCISAIRSAVHECDIRCITCVPGYPITDLAQHLIDEAHAEWCINEKVAMDIALGASACGSRSMVIGKHVGMNVLSDPLITASTHTIGAGIVIIAGDDPMAAASQNEQDSRYWGLLAEVPVLDPNPANMYDALCDAYRIAEAVRTPAIIRVTDQLMRSDCTVKEKQIRNEPELHLFDRSIWEYSMRGRHQLFHKNTYPLMKNLSERSHLNVCREGNASSCIISSGYASMVVESIMHQKSIEIPHLSLSFVNPLPIKCITDFIGDRRALVVEETEPVIENQLQIHDILGRRSGHLPYGGLAKEDILFAMEHINKERITLDITPETLKNRGFTRTICEDCPFIPTYEAIKNIKNDFSTKNRVKTALRTGIGSTQFHTIKKDNNLLIAGDMGCSIRTAPIGVVDVAYALGSAIGIASGMPGKGIAIIGDFGSMHSGIQALIDAESKNRDVLAIILQNRVSAMTGGQGVMDLTDVVNACCSDVTIIDETVDQRSIERLIMEKLGKRGASVIIACGECRKYRAEDNDKSVEHSTIECV